MTIRKLASLIAEKEGKKSQARIGDVREVLGILSDILFDDWDNCKNDVLYALLQNGTKRAKRQKKVLKRTFK